MAYNEFTLEKAKQQFGLTTIEKEDYFASVPPTRISNNLRHHLNKCIPMAFAIGTEKARSELLIMPVLLEAHDHVDQAFSLFSGVLFNVDAELGLVGVCDYLLSLSPEQFIVEAPVVAIVEAKNENIRQGISQCIAEMVAAQKFNQEKNNPLTTVYGLVTTGTNWLFLRLLGKTVYIDRSEYHISQAERIVGILTAMIHEAQNAMQPEI